MVGEKRSMELKDILTEKETEHILKQALGKDVTWNLKWSEVRPAIDGIAGFLGDHMKAVLHVNIAGEEETVKLFIKRIPEDNKAKAEFITENNFFKREKLMYRVLEEICEDGVKPWCVKAYLFTDTMIVMPDLTLEGYATRNFAEVLDAEHIFIATSSIARFHAAYVNYETKKSKNLKQPYRISQEYGDILKEKVFCEGPFLRTCAKLSTNLLKTFSVKSYRDLPDLESKLTQLYIEASDRLTESEDKLNVLLHNDLWVNNIMFKYENNVPINAILVDYQGTRYGPPAFDMMLFLYLSTDRNFRQACENDVFSHYFSEFLKNLNDDSTERLKRIGYDKDEFLKWCDKARMFGMIIAIALHPFMLMDPKTAKETFDNPDTFEKHSLEDRSEPVIAHANECEQYRLRNLGVTEEFVETYLLKQL